MKIQLFVPCYIDQLFPTVAWSCVELLEAAGHQVAFDTRATCCGQPAFNSGYPTEASRVAAHLLKVLTLTSEPVVIPSGSCTAMMLQHYDQLPFDDETRQQWQHLKPRVFEFAHFWVEQLGNPALKSTPSGKWMLHRSCHGLRELGITHYIEEILNKAGADWVPSDDFDRCCGFGGTFSIKFPELAAAMADEKNAHIQSLQVDGVVAGDVSCLMHLSGRARLQGNAPAYKHIADWMLGK